MQKAKQRLTSLVVACVMMIACLFAAITTLVMPQTTAVADGTWTLVTNVSDLAVGDQIVIVAKESDVAMSTTQNSNNRGQANVTKNGNTVTVGSDVQQFTLQEGTTSGTFAFYTGSGYIYAAGGTGKNNYLRTQDTLSLEGSWTITITSGAATIKTAQSTVARHTLMYNKTSKLFSCYASGQAAIQLYKLETTPIDPTEPSIKITLDGDNYAQVGATFNFTAETANADDETVTWKSSNPTVADFENGVVTAKAMGETTISASVADVESNEIAIKVYPVENSTLSIAEAVEVAKLAGTENSPYSYSAKGVITNITGSETTITAEGNSIIAYGMTPAENETGTANVDTEIIVTGKLVNYNNSKIEFASGCTYTIVVDEKTEKIKEALNQITAKMNLAYSYKTEETTEELPDGATDILNHAFIGIEGTSYIDWSNKTSKSSAVYAGQSAGGNDSIQLRSNNSNSGIVTTTSGGKATKITVVWNANTGANRTLEVYGSNTPYESPTELYNTNSNTKTDSTKIGTIVCGTSTELEIKGDYAYIGLRSNSGALYLDEVQIDWNGGDGVEGGIKPVTEYKESNFKILCGVDADLANIEGVSEYGIMVTAEGYEPVKYTGEAQLVEAGDLIYVVIKLGDIINDLAKLGTEFTVQAYVIVDSTSYVSTQSTTYSVKSMVEKYYGMESVKSQVEHLYNYLFDIKEVA